jgi:hypothetical protein
MRFYISFCGFEPGGIIMPVEARLARADDNPVGMWTYIIEAISLHRAIDIATNMYVTELNSMWEENK